LKNNKKFIANRKSSGRRPKALSLLTSNYPGRKIGEAQGPSSLARGHTSKSSYLINKNKQNFKITRHPYSLVSNNCYEKVTPFFK
jgi:hypothetical protein